MSLLRSSLPEVSVVMAARDAERTLRESVESLLAQTYPQWELIIVDDGSSDDTATVAQRLCAQDGRIRYLFQEHAGASQARNRGLTQARGEWLLFLDSDDTVAPEYLEVMLAAAREQIADVVVCGYARIVGPDGAAFECPRQPISRDGCAEVAAKAHFPLHAAIARREVIERVGGFEPSLEACEDWDLWLKVAGHGAAFATVPRCLALYRNSPQSLSKSFEKMMRGAHEVLGRQKREAYGPAIARYKPTARQFAARRTWFYLWCSAMALAREEMPPVFPEVKGELGAPGPGDRWPAEALAEGWSLGANLPVHELLGRWEEMKGRLEPVFLSLEERTGKHGLAASLMKDLVVELFRHGRLEQVILEQDIALVRLVDLLRSTKLPPEVDALYVQCSIRGELFRIPGIPMLASTKPWDLIRIAAFEMVCKVKPWSRKRRALRTLLKSLAGLPARGDTPLVEAVQKVYAIAPITPEEEPGREAVPDNGRGATDTAEADDPGKERSNTEVWEALFATENPWDYGNVYEQTKYEQTLDLLPPGTFDHALELACAEGHFTVQLCDRVTRLRAVDISQAAIRRARERCQGKENVEFSALDFMTQPIGEGYDLIVCSEVLYYAETREQLEAVIAKLVQALKPGGHLLTAHARLLADDATRTGFDWDHAFGADGIVNTMLENGGLALDATVATELYRIDLLKKAPVGSGTARRTTAAYGTPLPVQVASRVVWQGARRTRMEACAAASTGRLPVLMYHHIATSGPEELERYRVSPDKFERQLRYLRRRGYYSLEPDAINPDWPQQEFAGRPLIITFDDGYADFESVAWPILRRNGFSAHVFISTGHVGGVADWEEDEAGRVRLMTWEQMRRLSAQGVTFGSHLVSHVPATSLGSGGLLEQASRSRLTLERALGKPVFSIAPPYGAMGFREERIFQAAGYRTIYAAGTDAVARAGQPVLPRIRADGQQDLAVFGRTMEVEDPELDVCERHGAGFLRTA